MHKAIGLLALGLGAAVAAERPDLNGVWQLTGNPATDSKLKAEVLTIHQSEDSVEIADARTAKNGKETKDDIQCNTMGQECKLKNLHVSLYYNGPRLVMVQTEHDVVTKKRFMPSDDGKTLNLEVIHMAPGPEKTETLTFTKQQS